MNINSMLNESFIIMVLGMAVVFFFLSLMIFVVNIFNKIINKKNIEKAEVQQSLMDNEAIISEDQHNESDNIEDEVVSAIYIAIKEYEKEKILN